MENEALFAAEPEVDAQVRARTRRTEEVTENTPLIAEINTPLHGPSIPISDAWLQWRRPSVSEYKIAMNLQEQMSDDYCNDDRSGG